MQMQSFSQYKQDDLVYNRFFLDKSDGFFVDIGAHDGKFLSNTLFYENLGWNGLCFEPLPNIFPKLVENRPKSQCHQCAIGHENKKVHFLEVTGPSDMLSGVLDYYSPDHMFRINREVQAFGGDQRGIIVDMFELKHFLEPGKEIDYLSLDTEGGEDVILENILQSFMPRVMTVEANTLPDMKNIMSKVSDKYNLRLQAGCDLILERK